MTVYYFPRHTCLGRRRCGPRLRVTNPRGGGEGFAAVFSDPPGRRWQGRNWCLVVTTPGEEVGVAAFPMI